jgi:hypothetical protein
VTIRNTLNGTKGKRIPMKNVKTILLMYVPKYILMKTSSMTSKIGKEAIAD